LAKWATRKVSKQLRDGNPRPVHWANIVALVCGLVTFAAPLAIIFGIIGIRASGKDKEYSGEGMGIAGLVLGIISLILLVAAIIAVLRNGLLP
jgi:hypothetical protein